MNVGWLLDSNVLEHYHDEMAAAVRKIGGEVVSINRPNAPYTWDDTSGSYRKAFPRGACVVAHADIDLVRRVIEDQYWSPGAFANVAQFHCSHYFSHLGRFLLNRDYAMLPFGELQRCADFLFETFGRDGRIFVRPDLPLKLFTGQIASRETFAKDVEFMGFYEFPLESLVVVSSPKTILKEWRFVIVEEALVAGSQYKNGDQLDYRHEYDHNAFELGKSVAAAGFSPDPAWVMDICQTADSQYHLLEIGGFSFADLYACNKDDVVQAVSAAALAIWKRNNA